MIFLRLKTISLSMLMGLVSLPGIMPPQAVAQPFMPTALPHSTPAPLRDQPKVVSYQCDAERSFRVVYSQESAELMLDSINTIPLRRMVSASGLRFTNGSTSLYSQGNSALIQEGDRETFSNCVTQDTALQNMPGVFAYQCANDGSFEARYQPERVELRLNGGQRYTLPQVPSASGVRYSDGDTTLFTKGNAAFIEMNGAIAYEDCSTQTAFREAPAPRPHGSRPPRPPVPQYTPAIVQPAPPTPVPSPSVPEPAVRGMW